MSSNVEYLMREGQRCIAVDGVDCTGKGSVTSLMEKNLTNEDREFMRVEFPQYDLPSGAMIKAYLEGKYGDFSRRLQIPVGAESASEWVALTMGRMENTLHDMDYIAHLYALNRVEWFRTVYPNISAEKVIVFDRFYYSNLIHILSPFMNWIMSPAGKDLMTVEWRSSFFHDSMTAGEYIQKRVLHAATRIADKWEAYEHQNGVVYPYHFILLLNEDSVRERLSQRKIAKQVEHDIHEEGSNLHFACEFLSAPQFAPIRNKIMAAKYIPVAPFGTNNLGIAEEIVELYDKARENGIPTLYFNYMNNETGKLEIPDEEDDVDMDIEEFGELLAQVKGGDL